MNKKIFISLVIMMALSIIGITLVQIRWISSAVRIRNENFNMAAINSLVAAANDIDMRRQMNLFNYNAFPPSPDIDDSLGLLEGYVNFGGYVSDEGGSFSINITNHLGRIVGPGGNMYNENLVISGDSLANADTVELLISPADDPGTIRVLKEGEKMNPSDGGVVVKSITSLFLIRLPILSFMKMTLLPSS